MTHPGHEWRGEYAASMTLRLVLAEDSYLMREGISALIALDDELELVATCESYDGLLAAGDEHRPDVVLTDIRMPPTQTDEGIRAARQIRTEHPEIGVVVLSQYVEPDYAMRLFEDGSEGRAYLLKERVADLDELSAAIRRVHEGGSVVDPKVVDALISARHAAVNDNWPLTGHYICAAHRLLAFELRSLARFGVLASKSQLMHA